jgi:hypothetical protein
MARLLVLVGGVSILLSSIPHALLAWPPAVERLQAAGVEADVIAGLAVGWYFGSVAMVALGGAALACAPHVATARFAWRVPLWIGLVYGAFGAAAVAGRGARPQFFLFVASGALLVAGALIGRRAAERAS